MGAGGTPAEFPFWIAEPNCCASLAREQPSVPIHTRRLALAYQDVQQAPILKLEWNGNPRTWPNKIPPA
jgi:hypothetical protein